jgi:hypothetical protein
LIRSYNKPTAKDLSGTFRDALDFPHRSAENERAAGRDRLTIEPVNVYSGWTVAVCHWKTHSLSGRIAVKPKNVFWRKGWASTHGTVAGTPVFKTGALNHSVTLPAQEFGDGAVRALLSIG